VDSFNIPQLVLMVEEVEEGDEVQLQLVIDFWKIDLPSLSKIIIESKIKMKGRVKEKYDCMRKIWIHNLYLKEQTRQWEK
jgi:hypothetical protein